ncbi:glycosyltransferase family 2 protein [Lactococcus cremoris]|uniref:Glycosyl transferase n=2 Tax=Lactococcus lactis subsp. cremoris TaxID=1359 RepID=T0TKP6_LACLC|nr:glycosyltransferase family 2 protein [Lactococcus cremoris]EQC56208.1 glycosyl transferase [Lactococcus cremoris subsp. cremoris TIFN6]AHX98263.1 glycosyltransferase [Lactococcus cremoris]ARE29508.1 glycosyltransferase family 2 protein [Lactococcus cremoris]EUN34511.1 glycosyl transferase GT2 family [Lactococcus cremoris subsp. cremoris HP]MCT4464249.1 glycosyltransferase [Lactococcus cremoris]
MNKVIKHTFVICAYMQSPYLEESIKSILDQGSIKKGISEVVLYTSTPNDYIENICHKYNIKIFIGEGGGIGADWNGALAAVQTKYATIVHQDDLYDKKYGEMIINDFESQKDSNIVFTDYYEIDEYSKPRKRNINLKIKSLGLKLMSFWENKKYQRRVYSFGNFICCPAVSYNMERLKDFRFNEEMKMAVDWDAWERIMKKSGHVHYLPLKLMAHRIHSDSETTNNTLNKNREKEEHEMFRRYWGETMAKLLMKVYTNNQKGNS